MNSLEIQREIIGIWGKSRKNFIGNYVQDGTWKINRIFNRHKRVTWQKTLVQGLANDGASADHPLFDYSVPGAQPRPSVLYGLWLLSRFSGRVAQLRPGGLQSLKYLLSGPSQNDLQVDRMYVGRHYR